MRAAADVGSLWLVHVCVVGAGIVGAAVAYNLAARQAPVTVLDATHEPRGATWASFGWINANGKNPAHYMELNRAGMAAHADLARQLGDGTWLHPGGSIEWAPSAEGRDALLARVEDYASMGYAARILGDGELRNLEPALEPDPNPDMVAFFGDEAWADSHQLVRLLLEAARSSGANIRLGTHVTRIERRRDGPVTILLDDEAGMIEADMVVNCSGADARYLGEQAEFPVETAGAPGLNAVTAPLNAPLGRVVRSPGVHFRPESGGRVMISSPSADARLTEDVGVDELSASLLATAARHMPALAGVTIEESRVARRAMPPDGLPIVGRLPAVPWLYHVVTHSGVTLAPLLGRLAAEEIVRDDEATMLTPYRPARFAV